MSSVQRSPTTDKVRATEQVMSPMSFQRIYEFQNGTHYTARAADESIRVRASVRPQKVVAAGLRARRAGRDARATSSIRFIALGYVSGPRERGTQPGSEGEKQHVGTIVPVAT